MRQIAAALTKSALAMANFGSHTAFLATNLSPTLTRLLRAHEPVVSGFQTEISFGRGEE
ncbi:MAG TPA: hypothetical protein PLR25_06080 [Planctomycetaceae bacterium]|nr:hypothetical protein [Planctomycetaceae bacterium]